MRRAWEVDCVVQNLRLLSMPCLLLALTPAAEPAALAAKVTKMYQALRAGMVRSLAIEAPPGIMTRRVSMSFWTTPFSGVR